MGRLHPQPIPGDDVTDDEILRKMGIRTKKMAADDREAKAKAKKESLDIPKLEPATEHGNARFEVLIPAFRSASVNQLLSMHWGSRGTFKMQQMAVYAKALKAAGVTGAIGRRRLEIIVTLGKGQRRYDDDNPWKIPKDAMKQCGAIVDDTQKWVDHPEKVQYSGIREDEPSTLVILYDIEAEQWVAPKTVKKPKEKKKNGRKRK
jgi:hypothetical protein